MQTIRAIVRAGRIELLDDLQLPEGTELLVTPLVDEELFWLEASEPTLRRIWDNPEDDIYGELLKE